MQTRSHGLNPTIPTAQRGPQGRSISPPSPPRRNRSTRAPACRLRPELPIRRCAFWASTAAPWSVLVTRGHLCITRIVQSLLAQRCGRQAPLDGFRRRWRFWRNREKGALQGLGQLGHQIIHVGVQRKPLDDATGRTLPFTSPAKLGGYHYRVETLPGIEL